MNLYGSQSDSCIYITSCISGEATSYACTPRPVVTMSLSGSSNDISALCNDSKLYTIDVYGYSTYEGISLLNNSNYSKHKYLGELS